MAAEQKGSKKPEDILKELRFYYTKAILEKIKRLETENSVLQDLVESNKRFISPIIKNGADLEKKLDEAKEIIAELTKYANILEKIERKIKENGTSKEMQEVKMNVMRSKIEKEAKLSDLEKQKEKVIEDIGKTSNARVIVLKSIYPGTRLIINGVTENIKTENYNSTYQRKGVEIGFTPNI